MEVFSLPHSTCTPPQYLWAIVGPLYINHLLWGYSHSPYSTLPHWTCTPTQDLWEIVAPLKNKCEWRMGGVIKGPLMTSPLVYFLGSEGKLMR